LLIRGIRQLVTLRGPAEPRRGAALREIGLVEQGALLIRDGVIVQAGPARRVENLAEARDAREIDATGKVVLPGFVDSHTHLVHGPPRLLDYEMRLQGRSFEEIARSGGGILANMRHVRAWTASHLKSAALTALHRMAACGTTTVEAKSGYGLDESSELKALRVASSLDGHPLEVVPTFLGAHAVPPEYEGRPGNYIRWLAQYMIPEVARRRAAVFADINCDRNAFTVEQAETYLEAARSARLGLKLHAGQFASLGAVPLAIELRAASVDHLEAIEPHDAALLGGSPTIATLLPGSVFHLGLDRYAPARALIEAGAAVALATDFNPGSSPTPSMPMILSLACAQMRMTPEEAISAATINGAWALGRAARLGSLEVGKQADLAIFSVSDYREIPYCFGAPLVEMTLKRGFVVYHRNEVPWPEN
jgi:imidazolonepropionase